MKVGNIAKATAFKSFLHVSFYLLAYDRICGHVGACDHELWDPPLAPWNIEFPPSCSVPPPTNQYTLYM